MSWEIYIHFSLRLSDVFIRRTWNKPSEHIAHRHAEYPRQIQVLRDDVADRRVQRANGELQTMQSAIVISHRYCTYACPSRDIRDAMCNEDNFRSPLIVTTTLHRMKTSETALFAKAAYTHTSHWTFVIFFFFCSFF